MKVHFVNHYKTTSLSFLNKIFCCGEFYLQNEISCSLWPQRIFNVPTSQVFQLLSILQLHSIFAQYFVSVKLFIHNYLSNLKFLLEMFKLMFYCYNVSSDILCLFPAQIHKTLESNSTKYCCLNQ